MERPKDVPEEFWHNETPLACLRAVEEMAEFFWKLGVRREDEEPRLPEDWRARVEALIRRR